MTIADLLKHFPAETEIEATDGSRYFSTMSSILRPKTGKVCLTLHSACPVCDEPLDADDDRTYAPYHASCYRTADQ